MLSYYCSEKQAASRLVVLEHSTLSFKGPQRQSIGALFCSPNGFRGCDWEGHIVLRKLNRSEFFVTGDKAVVASQKCLLFFGCWDAGPTELC